MNKELIKPTVVLFAVTFIAALIIGVTYSITEEPIREQRANAEMAAIMALFPNTYAIQYREINEEGSTLTRLAQSLDYHGNVYGYVFSASPSGYSGAINMMVAIDLDGVIQGVRIVRHTETPGLGANITLDWFLEEFIGREGVLTSAHNPAADNEISIIASATISVNAVVRGVNDALAYFEREVQ